MTEDAPERESERREEVLILGLDAREPIASQVLFWNDERRLHFLVRPELKTPISVDRGVWPSITTNSDEGYPLGLWGNIDELLGDLSRAGRGGTQSDVIEIAVLASNEYSLSYWERIVFGRGRPDLGRSFRPVTEVLGYDVADRYLVSGLSNCMISPPGELRAVRSVWSDSVNSLGLFGEAAGGAAFSVICDQLIPEHAPFFVYRISKILI